MTQDTIRADHDYLLQMKKFPCSFNLESVGKITISRLRYIRHNLISELELGIDTNEELIRKKNLLTLVEFRLGDRNQALNLNNEVICLTNWTNISSLGNRCFIMVSIGDEPEAKRCLKCLKQIKKCPDVFDVYFTEAIAEQAYCYSRLGGSENLKLAMDLFTQVVQKRPDNYLWKFGLGLVCRRVTHTNIYCSSTDRLDVEEVKFLAVKYLFDVGENAESSYLRAMAYAQLVKLRQDHPSELFPQYNSLFRQNNIQRLCDKALEYGKEIPCVLTQCGRSFNTIDLDRAIDLLERSVSIKQNTIAYHNLGICYKKKAELLAKQRYIKNSGTIFIENFQNRCQSSFYTHQENPVDDNNIIALPFVNQSLDHVNEGPRQMLTSQSEVTESKPLDKLRGYEKQQFMNRENLDTVSLKNPNSECLRTSKRIFRSLSCDSIAVEPINMNEACTKEHNLERIFLHNNKDITENSRCPTPVYLRSFSESWSPRDEVKAFVASTATSVPLNRSDRFVQKAISCYRCAIDLSNGENLPASLDLGIILKQTGQVKEALTQFNSVTNSHLSLTGHRVTVISAYEQAGLCYLELSKVDNNNNCFDKDGQKKLTKAISLAADLAVTITELKDCAHDVWVALRTLLTELDRGPHCLNQQKQKIKLFELIRDHGQIIEVVQKLRELSEDQLDDKNVIRSALISYLNLGQPENALAFQNMLGVGQGVRDSLWWKADEMRTLRSKVLLHAISRRLGEANENPTYLFQQLFQLSYGKCVGLNTDIEDIQPVSTSKGDVLIVFDEDQDIDNCPSRTTRAAHYITQLSSCLFGLEAKENLQGTGEYGDVLPIQLREMRLYQVVILVVGGAYRNRLYEAMLERVSYNKDDCGTSNQRIIVIDAGPKGGHVPLCLAQYECLKLDDDDVSCHGNSGTYFPDGGDEFSSEDDIKQDLSAKVDFILKVFCFIIGQQWPCP